LSKDEYLENDKKENTMKKSFWMAAICAVFLVFITFSSTGAFEIILEEDIIERRVPETEIIPTVDNFIILFDASGRTYNEYKNTGQQIIEIEKQILRQQNAVTPELGYNAGLYTFTPFKAFYELQPYRKDDFAKAIDSLPTLEYKGQFVGMPALVDSFLALDQILAKYPGRTAIFIFTDGTYAFDKVHQMRPIQAARKLADKHDVAFYLISYASEEKNIKMLDAMSTVNASSRVIPIDALYNYQIIGGGALYVVKSTVIVETESDIRVAGVEVDNIQFDFNSTAIQGQNARELDELGTFLQNKPDTFAAIAGFSDSAGDKEYNMVLSRDRAESVAGYLVQNFNIDPFRLVLFWYGSQNPIADNATVEGRALNRRVEIEVGGSM
jgi:OOP family OmpA-OmpF porin